MPRARHGSLAAERGSRRAGERMREARAAARALADLDAAAVRLDDLARDGEPETGALLARGEEGLEDALAKLRRHARPAVVDRDLDALRASRSRRERDRTARGHDVRRRSRGDRAAPGR